MVRWRGAWVKQVKGRSRRIEVLATPHSLTPGEPKGHFLMGLCSRLGAANVVLRFVAQRRLILLATPPLFLEYEDVLKKPEHRLVHGLAPEQIDDWLAELGALVEPVELHFRGRPQVGDPGDEMVLEAAINGDADALVTYNVSDFAIAADRFGVSVLRPIDVLKRIKP
jgi:predicted nucleic acid-binding protein